MQLLSRLPKGPRVGGDSDGILNYHNMSQPESSRAVESGGNTTSSNHNNQKQNRGDDDINSLLDNIVDSRAPVLSETMLAQRKKIAGLLSRALRSNVQLKQYQLDGIQWMIVRHIMPQLPYHIENA